MSSEPKIIAEVLEQTIKKLKITGRLKQGSIFNDWAKMVGKQIALKAKPLFLRNGCLTLETDSPAWSQELSFMEEALIEKINKSAGECLVKKIRFKTK